MASEQPTPPTTIATEQPTRRSSRRGDRSSSYTPNGGLSKDEIAFSVLLTHVLEGEFTPVRDPDNVMTKIWVREGKEQKEDGDGVDWVKEDGFTVKKYDKFWRTEMAELEDVIMEWGHKLPAEAKAHLPKEYFDDDDDEGVEVALAAENDAKVVTPTDGATKPKRKKRTPGTNAKKTNRKKQKIVEESDDEDGVPAELVAPRKEWYDALEGGRAKVVGVPEDETKTLPADSLEKQEERAKSTRDLFVQNAAGYPDAAEYKKLSLDPVFKRVIDRVDAYVSSEAAKLRNELLKDMCLSNYKCTDVDKVIVGGEEADKDKSSNKGKVISEGKDTDEG